MPTYSAVIELIVEWLTQFPDMTAAQIYDWLKERCPMETLDFQKRSFQDYVNSDSVSAIFRPTETQLELFIEMFADRLPEYIRNSLTKSAMAA